MTSAFKILSTISMIICSVLGNQITLASEKHISLEESSDSGFPRPNIPLQMNPLEGEPKKLIWSDLTLAEIDICCNYFASRNKEVEMPDWVGLLTKLDLSFQQLGDRGACKVARHIKGSQWEELNFNGDLIGDKGAIILAKHLSRSKVRTINFLWNKITDKGAKEFAKELAKSTSPEKTYAVDFSMNSVTNKCALKLKTKYPYIQWSF